MIKTTKQILTIEPKDKEYILQALKNKKLKCKDIAKELNITTIYVSYMLNGKKPITAKNLQAIEKLLNIKL